MGKFCPERRGGVIEAPTALVGGVGWGGGGGTRLITPDTDQTHLPFTTPRPRPRPTTRLEVRRPASSSTTISRLVFHGH